MTDGGRTILVCRGSGCTSAGSPRIQEALEDNLAELNLSDTTRVKLTGCHGFCHRGPVVVVEPEDTAYLNVTPDDVPEIVESDIVSGVPVERLLYHDPCTGEVIGRYRDIPFNREQERVLLSRCGRVNPEDIDDYIEHDGYAALRRALSDMTPTQIINELKVSGLRGSGGAGFPTWRKWEASLQAGGDEKYVVCNANEGDPGAFVDRSVLEADPHAVIEGMIIAGRTIGSSFGYIYVCVDYLLAIKRLQIALEQARAKGFLGKNILGSGFDFDLALFQGVGAFICGESTAMTRSIEGRRAMPNATPRPRTTEVGLFDKPTVLNNVRTFAYVPQILNRGGDWFSTIGVENNTGTAIFALTGMIENSGLVEVPLGTTLRRVIYDIGGGIQGGGEFKAVQTGGPSGGCLPASLLDMPVDFDSLTAAGSMLGSGGLVVMDTTTCMVDVARFFLDFTQKESCGQCTVCKLGTKQMLNVLEDIVAGEGRPGDVEFLVDLGEAVGATSLCGLGQSAANPVLTTIRYFRDEYDAHILDKSCPALVCKPLISYRIDPERCVGCTACAGACPVEAISGQRKQVHVIDQDKCTRCGVCLGKCPKRYQAVECVSGRIQRGR